MNVGKPQLLIYMALVVHLMLCALHNSMYLSNGMVLDNVHIMLKLTFNQLHSVRHVPGIVKINTIFSSLFTFIII